MKKIALLNMLFILTLIGCNGNSAPKTYNQAPIAIADIANTDEETTLNVTQTNGVLSNDSDPENHTLLVTQISSGTSTANAGDALVLPKGTLTVNANGSYIFIPTANFFGNATITYSVSDGELTTQSTLSININAINDAPVIAQNQSVFLNQGSTTVLSIIVSDEEDDNLTFSVTGGSLYGATTIQDNNLTYVSDANYSGSDYITLVANDSFDNSNEVNISITIEPISFIKFIIVESNGSKISSVNVELIDVNNSTVLSQNTSDVNGSLTYADRLNKNVIAKLSKDGFANQIVPFKLPILQGFTTEKSITMIRRGATQSLNISTGGTISGINGASVEITSDSFVDSNGEAVSGDIEINITPVDVSDPVILGAFPGSFSGILENDGSTSQIASVGTVEFIFTKDGERLQLASDKTAIIELPIFIAINPVTGDPIEIGDQIALWSLDEESGIWTQEGNGIVIANIDSPTGLALHATVSHFTWWNVDYPIPFATVDITVNDSANSNSLVEIHVRAIGSMITGFANQTIISGTTSSGQPLPVGPQSCIWVEYTDSTGQSATSTQQCIQNVTDGQNYQLTFDIATAGDLVLSQYLSDSNSYNHATTEKTKYIDQTFNLIFTPQTLESQVAYTITSGSLPTGLTLSSTSATKATITGSSTILGAYLLTIEGTDSDGYNDTIDLTITIKSKVAPIINSNNNITLYANTGDNLSESLNSKIVSQGGSPITSWVIFNDDGSQVATNVTISNSGEFTLTNYSGTPATYYAYAYNTEGVSDAIHVTVTDTLALTIPDSYDHIFFQGEDPVIADLYADHGSNPATSWNITLQGGGQLPSGVSINNQGIVSVPYQYASGYTYSVTASNSAEISNVLTLTFMEDIGCDPLFGCL